MASDKNHRPCLPLKPQEKNLISLQSLVEAIINKSILKLLGFASGGLKLQDKGKPEWDAKLTINCNKKNFL